MAEKEVIEKAEEKAQDDAPATEKDVDKEIFEEKQKRLAEREELVEAREIKVSNQVSEVRKMLEEMKQGGQGYVAQPIKKDEGAEKIKKMFEGTGLNPLEMEKKDD